jgi:radical SAM superfamily enzyme YgiQ (UPF0313 family)
MRVGILDILALPSRHPADTGYHLLITKQFASITPQAIAVWCRRLGHETFYATYYGVGAAHSLLPSDLDVIFIACYTQASPIAYALGMLYRKVGARTVIGGPHAKAFPLDCLRFFDLVVQECDQNLIADILAGHFDPGSLISSAQPFDDVPTVEERMPEIRASAFFWGRQPLALSTIPMLASMGCPYQCNFCIDWNNPYRALSRDRLAADLRYLAQHLPGTLVVFHDPNFAVKFDQMFEVLEALPPDARPPYMMESSLTVLRGERVKRLKATNCVLVAPGVESWTNYSNKAGVGQKGGVEKVNRVVEHFQLLGENVPYLQANFMFGLDTDLGDTPTDLTKLFMDQTPFVWPAINIPVPFGGTPLYEELLGQDRILKAMPFSFYYAPYLVTTLKHYDPVTYYEKLIELFAHAASPSMLKRRLQSTSHGRIKLVHWARTASTRASLKSYRQILQMLRSDAQFRAFHEGRSAVLPEFYHQMYERMLKQYAGLLSRADRAPNLDRSSESSNPAKQRPVAQPDGAASHSA